MMRKKALSLALSLVITTNSYAGCCTCTQQYSDLTDALVELAGWVVAATAAQKKETGELDAVKKRAVLMLSYDKHRSEITSQAKLVDSAGFASTINRFKAERIGTEAITSEAMRNGYEISDQDAEKITEDAFK